MEPLLYLLGAGENTLRYGKQYLTATTVIGGLPTLLSMCMPQLLRNAGYATQASIGISKTRPMTKMNVRKLLM